MFIESRKFPQTLKAPEEQNVLIHKRISLLWS